MIYESVTELIEDCRERRREKEEAEAEEREEREAQMKGHDAKADLEKGARRKSGQKKALLSPLSPAGSSGTDSATSNASNSASSAAVVSYKSHVCVCCCLLLFTQTCSSRVISSLALHVHKHSTTLHFPTCIVVVLACSLCILFYLLF